MEQYKTLVVELPIGDIHPYEGAHNTDDAIKAIIESIKEFGIYQPITVDKNHVIAKGNAVYKAAKELGYKTIPCIVKDDLTDEQIAQYRIADNQTSTFAKWNAEKLKKELACMPQPTSMQPFFDEDISSILGHNPFEKPKAKKEEPKDEAEKDKAFKDDIKKAEKEMEVKPVQYFEYVCSKCGRKVTVRL